MAHVFANGYNAMLEEPSIWHARFIRDTLDSTYRGGCVEGIGMGLAVVDLTSPFSLHLKENEGRPSEDSLYANVYEKLEREITEDDPANRKVLTDESSA